MNRLSIFLTIFFITMSSAFVLPQNLANCSPPNGTDVAMHWWQCNSGPVQFYNATPFDSTGTNYEYPIHLGKPIVMKTQINNPSNTYTAGNLKNSIKIWKYGGWSGCSWASIPTLGLLKNLDACTHGVPCPVKPGKQELDVVVDFTQFEAIINMLKDNQPYQLEYLLHDKASGDEACLMVQSWAFIH